MKHGKFFKANTILLLLVIMSISACKKVDGDYVHTNTTKVFTGTTYDYLKSKPGVFDSLLHVVDLLNLKPTLETGEVTLFACTNASFEQVVTKLNIARSLAGKPRIYLKDIKRNLLDSIVCKYIVQGKHIADSMALINGLVMSGARYSFPMNGKLNTSTATGQLKGGPVVIVFSNTQKSIFTRDWLRTTANAVDIKTSNGVIHILEETHPFGFGEYSKPSPEPYTLSKFRPGGYTGPFVFPSVVNGTVLMESEDFDSGGQGVGYFDTTLPATPLVSGNAGGNYRIDESVDIEAPHAAATDMAGYFPSSHGIGSSAAKEWLIYSVMVPEEGDYTITTRASSGGNNNAKSFHIEFNFKNLTGPLSFFKPAVNAGYNNYNILVSSPVVHLKAGEYLMRFYFETNEFNITNFVVKRVN
ncbi:MAG: fasciclin domain-containing protein [Sphingobacteriaceae bacterium]|nr:fasciclin domain-containing protein [Sphingobacteriaceae bacterium]